MSTDDTDGARIIETRKLQCDIDENLHDAFRILAIQYKMTGRALMEKLILQEVQHQSSIQKELDKLNK